MYTVPSSSSNASHSSDASPRHLLAASPRAPAVVAVERVRRLYLIPHGRRLPPRRRPRTVVRPTGNQQPSAAKLDAVTRPRPKVRPRRLLHAVRYLLRLAPCQPVVVAPRDEYLLVVLAERQDDRTRPAIDDRTGIAARAVPVRDDHLPLPPRPPAIGAAPHENIDLVIVPSRVTPRLTERQHRALNGYHKRGYAVLRVAAHTRHEQLRLFHVHASAAGLRPPLGLQSYHIAPALSLFPIILYQISPINLTITRNVARNGA